MPGLHPRRHALKPRRPSAQKAGNSGRQWSAQRWEFFWQWPRKTDMQRSRYKSDRMKKKLSHAAMWHLVILSMGISCARAQETARLETLGNTEAMCGPI